MSRLEALKGNFQLLLKGAGKASEAGNVLCFSFLAESSVRQRCHQMHRYQELLSHIGLLYRCAGFHVSRDCPTGKLSLVCGFLCVSGEVQLMGVMRKSFCLCVLNVLSLFYRQFFLSCF